MNVSTTTTCRLCHASLPEPFVHFDSVPVAGMYLRREQIGQEPLLPLSVHRCDVCSLIQLSQIVSAELYLRYMFSGGHLNGYCRDVQRVAKLLSAFGVRRGARVVEAGSNDGTLLRFLTGAGFEAIGFEPSRALPDAPSRNGSATIRDYFSTESLRRHSVSGASAVVARHVLEHVADLHDFVAAMREALQPAGLAVIEVPDVLALLAQDVAGNLYHQHLTYFSVDTLIRLMSEHGFGHLASMRGDAHGGSIVGVFGKDVGSAEDRIDPRLLGRVDRGRTTRFAARVQRYLEGFRRMLGELKGIGSVAGWGAAERTTALLGLAKVSEGQIDYFVDRNSAYHGLYLPKVHSPVYSPSHLDEQPPAHTIIFARSFEDDIVAEGDEYLQQGGVLVSIRDGTFERIGQPCA